MDNKDELISVQREFIKHLCDFIDKHAGFLYAHGIEVGEEDVMKGVELSTKLHMLENELNK